MSEDVLKLDDYRRGPSPIHTVDHRARLEECLRLLDEARARQAEKAEPEIEDRHKRTPVEERAIARARAERGR